LGIRLSHADGRLQLVISDDGLGFEGPADSSATGRGLANVAERARLLGARLTIATNQPTGTVVRVDLPLKGPESTRANDPA
jgi:two-component system NarL family sensor kinase